MFEETPKPKVKGICPYCNGVVLEFDACYICKECRMCWSKGLNEWEKDNENTCCCNKPKRIQDSIFCTCGKIIKEKQ